MTDAKDKKFLKNIESFIEKNLDFTVSFNFRDKRSFKMFNILNGKHVKNLFQLYINGNNHEKILECIDSPLFNFNHYKMSLEQYMRLRMQFKGWKCYDNAVYIYTDGSMHQICGNFKGNIKDFRKLFKGRFDFVICTKICHQVCFLRKLKIKI